MPESPPRPAPPLETGEALSRFGKWCMENLATAARKVAAETAGARKWCAANPGAAALLAGCVGTVVYFLGFYYAFRNGEETAAMWTWRSWNSENNQEHSWGVLPIAIWLIWYHRGDIQRARKEPSNAGLAWVLAGVLAFILAVRTLQPRMAICALPLLLYGGVRYLWGRETGRVFIFPCLFLLFMVPVGGYVQGTVWLQLHVSSAVQVLASLIGVQIVKEGTGLHALDGTFNFDIAEGCSGIRSLMAMITLSALYVHFNLRETWKQWVIFAGSIIFALIGNVGRVFSVVVVARFVSERIAGGLYHDYSGTFFSPSPLARWSALPSC